MTDEDCIATKGDGEPCENPIKYADQKCGVHTDVTDTGPGRPTNFTDERARLAIEAARDGVSIAGCERAAGVGQKTIDGWLDQNHTFETEEGLVTDFSHAFARARAKGEQQCIRNGRSENGNPSFEKFLLASSFGYKKTEQTELTGEGGGGIVINTTPGGGDSDE